MVVYIYRMNINDKYYIGSTKDIKLRILNHKSYCYNEHAQQYNFKVYKYIREYCDDWSEVSFDILDVYDVISKEFRREIEQYYIDYFNNNLNMCRAKYDKEKADKKFKLKYKNDEEYRNKVNEKRRLRYKNDEEYRNKVNDKRNINVQCECGRIVYFGSLGKHRKTKIHQKLLNK